MLDQNKHRIMKKNLLRSTLFYFFALFCPLLIVGNSAIAQSVTASGTDATCPNSATVTATATGLSNPIGYQLLQGTTIVRPIGGSGWASTNVFTDLPAGTYTVKAKDGNDNNLVVTSATVTVTENYTPITASVSPVSTVGCTAGATATLKVNATGGSGSLSYAVTPLVGAGDVAPTSGYQNSPDFPGLAPGSYNFWIKDSACPSATSVHTTGVYTNTQPKPADNSNNALDIRLDYAYLVLKNVGTATGGYKIKASDFFYGNYVYLTAAEKQFYTVEVYDATAFKSYPPQPYASGEYNFPAGSDLEDHDLKYIVRNICDNTSFTFDVKQTGPDITAFANCGKIQAQWIIKQVSLVSVPAIITFTDAVTGLPTGTNALNGAPSPFTVTQQNDGPTYVDFPPGTTGVNWKVVDHDGREWTGFLDFSKDLTGGGVNGKFLWSSTNKCAINQASMLVELTGIPQQVTGMTYEVIDSSTNPSMIGHTGRLVPGPYNQNYYVEYSPGLIYWPSGQYKIQIHAPLPGGCYDNKILDVSAYGYVVNVTGVNKTANCGSFNFTVEGAFNVSNPADLELIILDGPGSTIGTTRNVINSNTTQSFTNMPYGTYTVALRVKGQTCNLIDALPPIAFTANSSIDFDALNSGGFACGPNGTGDLLVTASTVVTGAHLEYSIDNGATWQTENVFHNVPIGTHPIKIRETACGTETTQNVTVIQTIEATINNNPISETVCVGGNAVLNVNAIGGTLYTWTYPDGSTHTGKVQNLSNVTPAMAGVYSVVVTTSSCTSPAQTVTLNVLTKPTVNVVPAQTACNGELKAIVFTGTQGLKYSNPTTSTPVATTYTWTNDNPAIGLAASGTGDISFTGVNTGTAPIVANITVTPGNGIGCPGAPQTFTITVNPSVAKPTITGSTTYCTLSAGTTLTSSASTANQWYKDGVAISGATAQTYVATAAGSYTVAISGNGTCSAPSEPIVLTESACKITATKTIVGNPASVKPGDVLTYNITITNSFGTAKAGVTASDDVPTTLTNITNISNGGTLSGNKIDWTALTIPANGSLTLSFTATVVSSLPVGTTTIKNIASVVDPSDPNNPEKPEVEKPTEGKITATKTIVGNPASVKPGDVLTYNITLTNNYGTAKTGVTVSDAVPSTLTNITGIDNGGILTGNTINWNNLTVPANGKLVLSFKATVAANLPVGTTTIKNIASVVDPTDPNNPVKPEVEKPTEGKITATKTIVGNPATVKSGDVLTYNITLTNNYGTAKTGVTVTDDLPIQLQNITNINNGGTLVGNTINWSNLTVPANGTLILSFNATVKVNLPASTTSIKNTAVVTDPIDPSNPVKPFVEVPTTIIDFFIPNLYTPNGDGTNDTFVIRGLEMFAENDLVVVNRWGNEVYKQKNYRNDWSGDGLNEGTYFYVLRVKENTGSDWKVYKGYVTIIRTFNK